MLEVGIFALKALVIVVSLISIIVVIALLATRGGQKSELEVKPIHKRFKEYEFFLKTFSQSKEEIKDERKKRKSEAKKAKKQSHDRKIFFLKFDGDTKASQVENLREEITAVLQAATTNDEVVVRLESPGGAVTGYGLAASQLARIREKGIPLTICVDEVAASGGYMMACVANRILAAPFAIVGSIGVVSHVPNVHKILKKNDIDVKEYTAGEYKRTVTMLGEITPEKEQHFQERLGDIHDLFKRHVQKYRPQVDITKVGNGDFWFGHEALGMGLIDGMMTSDDYLLSFGKETPIFELTYSEKESFQDKISNIMGRAAEIGINKFWQKLERPRFF